MSIMSAPTVPAIDNFLDTVIDTPKTEADAFLDSDMALESAEETHIIEIPEGELDPRMKLLSHSSRTLLHTCPRKYQLYKLNSKTSSGEDKSTSVTFAYGTIVGIGIQMVLAGASEEKWMLAMLLEWYVDLDDSNPRQKKSFWEAVFAVQKFVEMQANGYLDDYELVTYKGRPAVELSFNIVLPDGYYYRGFVDVVLRHKDTGKILVLELKTASGTPNSSTYKNSGQAIGYSVVLDIIFPELSAYEVLYLVYGTTSRAYVQFYFSKSLFQRALWLQDLIIDCELVGLYHSYDSYPMHGESCYNFFKDCEYLGLCTLSTENLTSPLTQAKVDKMMVGLEEFQFTVDFNDLLESQLNKGD